MKTRILAGLCIVAVSGAAWAVELPVVPVSVMAQNVTPDPEPAGSIPVTTAPAAPAPRPPRRLFAPEIHPDATPVMTPATADLPAPPLKITNERSDITVMPGVTEIVPVALGQLNRIVTPFEHPELKTTSQAATRIDDGVVYLAPKSETPVGLYITEKGDESTAISITMIPKRIPPREIRLRLREGGMAGGYTAENNKARHWEEAYPYEETLRNILHAVALEKLPQGYSLGKGVPISRRSCLSREARRAGILYDFERGQTLAGANFDVIIGVAHNTGNAPVELKETWCANSGEVAAVAYWPEVVLEPNQATEVYVVRRHGSPAARTVTRPSLLERAP